MRMDTVAQYPGPITCLQSSKIQLLMLFYVPDRFSVVVQLLAQSPLLMVFVLFNSELEL